MDLIASGAVIVLFILALVVPLVLTMFFHKANNTKSKQEALVVPIGFNQPNLTILNGERKRTRSLLKGRAIQVPIFGSGLVNNTVYTIGQPGQVIRVKPSRKIRH